MSFCAKNKVTPHYVARARHAVRVHVHHVACARMYTCMHGARNAKCTTRTCAIARRTYKVCVQRRQALVTLQVWYNRFGGLLVCTHFRWVSVMDGLYSLVVLLSIIGWQCCVFHAVLFGAAFVCTMLLRTPVIGLVEKRCPRCIVPPPEGKIG